MKFLATLYTGEVGMELMFNAEHYAIAVSATPNPSQLRSAAWRSPATSRAQAYFRG
ncbi:hypothetical protein R50076_13880 [Gilvimarinus japonicus]